MVSAGGTETANIGENVMRISVVALTIALCCGYSCAETQYLDKDGTWKSASADKQGAYMTDIAKVKQLVSEGKAGKAARAMKDLRKAYPELETQGIGLFAEAEIMYAKRNFVKAAEKYTKFLDEHPGSDLYDGAMDRLFQIGTAFLNGQKKSLLGIFWIHAYEDGEKIMNSIADRAGDAPIAKRGLIGVAKSFEKRHLYRDAHRAWSDVSSRWPAGDIGREALHGMAVNIYAAYRGPKYEAGSLASARGYFQDLRSRYPEYAASIKTDQTLSRIEEQLAEKDLTIAMYYKRTGGQEGADLYFGEVKEKWPHTLAAEKAQELTAGSKR
jgi:outer membrane protein assembly factor BamD (BamD/ComL family)